MAQKRRAPLLNRTVPLLTIALLAGALLAGCDSESLAPGPERPADQPPLSPDVRMQVSYDQREVTYSSVLPPGLIGSASGARARAKAGSDIENKGVMESYEVVRETRSYDDDGYLSRTYTHTDGHQRLGMPEKAFNDLKDQMPRRSASNPVTRFKLEGGKMEYIREDGTVEATASVDPERFRIDASTLDSIEARAERSVSPEERATRARQKLRNRGVSFDQMSERHVSFETKSDEKGLARVRRVIDLRFGKPIYLAYFREDGQPERIETRTYGRYSGLPIMQEEVSYEYGNKAGEWTVTSHTKTTRSDISVRFK